VKTIAADCGASNTLAAGMIDLRDNPLLREPLAGGHLNRRLLGHRGASPGLSSMKAPLNRTIKAHAPPTIVLAGPGHGAPGVLPLGYLEGTYSQIYPKTSEDEEDWIWPF
jgi:xylulose-5-phosphate/fructose-6-phosphate phosphoketolase